MSSSEPCSNCPMLAAQLRQMEALVFELQTDLALLIGEVQGIAARIAAELEHATMSRRNLLEQVQVRLEFAVEACVES